MFERRLLVLSAVLFLGVPAAAQNVMPAKRFDGRLELETKGKPAFGSGERKSSLTSIYNNTFTNGWFSTGGLGIWFDWGTVTSFDNSASATHHAVVELGLGYGTQLATGGTTAFIFYAFDGSTGWCSANGIGTFQMGAYLYGLPGTYPTWVATAWTFTLALENLFGPGVSGTWEQAEGPIGYGFDFIDDTNNGPLLVGRPNPTGDQDVFDFYDSTGQTCLGTYWFGGYSSTNPFASFYFDMRGWETWVIPYLQPRISPLVCLTSCGGRLHMDGEGAGADGDWMIINITVDVLYANPAEHLSALVAGPGNASTLSSFSSGCTFDVNPPILAVVVLGPPLPPPLGFTMPSGLATGTTFTFEYVVKDNGDSGCGNPPGKVVASNPLELHVP